MAKQEVTGASPTELDELRAEYPEEERDETFEEKYCLFQIPYQPEDYDGPPRRCKLYGSDPETGKCRFHKNRYNPKPENLLPPEQANLKHGAYADMETLKKHMSDREEALYNEILGWAETYHIDKENDPAVWDDLVILAGERVRQFRTSSWILENSETQSKPIFSPTGEIVKNETVPEGLSEEHRRITQMVVGLKRDLGLTRKEQFKQDAVDTVGESASALADTMKAMVTDGDRDYDPDDYDE